MHQHRRSLLPQQHDEHQGDRREPRTVQHGDSVERLQHLLCLPQLDRARRVHRHLRLLHFEAAQVLDVPQGHV